MKLMAVIRQRLIEAEYLPATRVQYERWIRRYVRHHLPRHPRETRRDGAVAYLTHLATVDRVAASTQNQALDAVAFLYETLGQPIDTSGLRAKMPRRVAEMYSHAEIMAAIDRLAGRDRLMASLCYGSGLGIGQCAKLRCEQVDFEQQCVAVGRRDVPLPSFGRDDLRAQVALAWGWPGNVDGYVFPSTRLHGGRCWHVSPSSLQKAMRAAQRGQSRIILPRDLRRAFADRLLEQYDVRTVQEVAGGDLRALIARKDALTRRAVVSPFDNL
jgi:integrase